MSGHMNGVTYRWVDVGDLSRGVSLMRKCLRGEGCGVYVNFGCMRKMLVLNMLLGWQSACVDFWEEFMRNPNIQKYGLFRTDNIFEVFVSHNKAFSMPMSLKGYDYWVCKVGYRINEFLYQELGTCDFGEITVCSIKKCRGDSGKTLVGFRRHGKQDNNN